MQRGIAVLASVCALIGAFYFAISKWGIRHETLDLFDEERQRPVAVEVAERVDYGMKADAGYWKLPVAVISNGNTVRNTEYSFLANVFAARGYLVVSVQQDNPSDPPLVTKVGLPYVGRLAVYEKGEANILFVLEQLKGLHPNADYDHLTLVGHSNGGDTAMYFAMQHPKMVSKVVTLDNLRVPFVLRDKLKILSFRSKDPQFKTDPGVVPTPEQCKKEGIDVVQTPYQHTWMSDRGPDFAKQSIEATLDRFLGGGDASDLAPVDTGRRIVADNGMPLP
jgi:pimeloyl-ACP methyl ester carboxylesterase